MEVARQERGVVSNCNRCNFQIHRANADARLTETLKSGGDLFVTSAPAHESIAARTIVDELRHQYVLAFAASAGAGWRGLTVRTKNKDLIVRARSGYRAGKHVGS